MLSNSTLSTSPDEYGYRYWCSFCGKPSVKGRRINAYHGILNGHGPQFGIRHIVKIFRNKRGSERLCDIEIKKTQKARELCKRFAAESGMKKAISFVPIFKAHMDETPLLPCSSDWRRPLLRDEWVLIEERIGKEFRTFLDEEGQPVKGTRAMFTLNAFMHYSYHCTSGSLVVCGFEGRFDENGTYHLKSPVIHSVNESFGDTDKGEIGILSVFRNHTCNILCEGLSKPDIVPEIFSSQITNICCTHDSDYLTSDDSCSEGEACPETPRERKLTPSAPPPYEE